MQRFSVESLVFKDSHCSLAQMRREVMKSHLYSSEGIAILLLISRDNNNVPRGRNQNSWLTQEKHQVCPSHRSQYKKKKQPPRSEVVNFSLLMLNKTLPGCFCLGFGKFVTHVCGHMRMLHGCREPSRKCCLVCEIWIPPSGVFGNVLAGTRARQYTPTWWMLSIA